MNYKASVLFLPRRHGRLPPVLRFEMFQCCLAAPLAGLLDLCLVINVRQLIIEMTGRPWAPILDVMEINKHNQSLLDDAYRILSN